MKRQAARQSRWGQERRLEFIDFRLYWEGRLNRSDLTGFFRISVPQASLDLAAYQDLAPNNMMYDRTQKAYVASPTFKPVLASPHSNSFLNELLRHNTGMIERGDSFIGWLPPIASLPLPARQADPTVLISLIRAMQKNEALIVDYRSMSNVDDRTLRTIYPTSFAHDGFRWHIRAFCFKSGIFKDFVLGRILEVLDSVIPPSPAPDDTAWETWIDVVIGPNPTYSSQKRRAIEHDYQMKNGEIKLRARKSQLFYLKRRLNLNENPGDPVDDTQQIVLLRVEPVTPIVESKADD